MKKKILSLLLLFFFLLLLFTFFLVKIFTMQTPNAQDRRGNTLVALNEIEKLTADADGISPASEVIEALREDLLLNSTGQDLSFIKTAGLLFLLFGILYLAVVLLYLYVKILRPFDKLERYAAEIAGGNLNLSFDYERTNYFGAFTWAFDHMREEILYARKREHTAIEENKTVIAALSHDIKTPIASIRAYSEGLEASLDSDYETRQRYISTIIKKCDQVTALVNDLVLHSLSELEKLEINCTEVAIRELIRESALFLDFPGLKLVEPVQDAVVIGDPKRITQILENLLNNAKKYAPGKEVLIYTEIVEDRYFIHVQDHGAGIPPEDMPFVLNKFYRGKNTRDMPGSGLGLYICSYIVEKMNGGLVLNNHSHGLDAAFYLLLKTS